MNKPLVQYISLYPARNQYEHYMLLVYISMSLYPARYSKGFFMISRQYVNALVQYISIYPTRYRKVSVFLFSLLQTLCALILHTSMSLYPARYSRKVYFWYPRNTSPPQYISLACKWLNNPVMEGKVFCHNV